MILLSFFKFQNFVDEALKIAISRLLSTPSVRKLNSNYEMLQKIPNCIKLNCKPTVGAKDFFELGFGET
jgi:hypothetical protein